MNWDLMERNVAAVNKKLAAKRAKFMEKQSKNPRSPRSLFAAMKDLRSGLQRNMEKD